LTGLTQLLEQNNISLPDFSKKKEGGSNSEDRERACTFIVGTSSSPSFIIDFGASIHMVSTKDTFSSLDMSKGLPIVLGDDSLTDSLGKGRIDLDHGSFNNVLYVPGLSSNILLVYQMTHTGSPKKVIFSLDDVEITENLNGKVIAKGVVDHTSKVYKFSHFLPYSNRCALLIHANEASKLWHEIFGHINYKYLSYLSEKDMVIGLPKIEFAKGVCQGCILGKHSKHKYEKASHERTFAPLELIHNDIAGPLPHMSMTQAKYAVTFIDDFSRYCWVHFLKHKSEVFDLFKVFRALVENQYGRKLKILRYENCGEYVKSKFI